MARIRTIKPEFATDEKLAKVSRDARLTFVLCITQADDDGLLPGNHRQLLAALYPLDDSVTFVKLSAWLEELIALGRLRWRETRDGSPILEIVHWSDHQKVDHKGKSLILPQLKPLGEESANVSRESREDVANVSRSDLGPTTYDLRPTTYEQRRPDADASDGATDSPASPPVAPAVRRLPAQKGARAPSWTALGSGWWVANVGAMSPGRLGKALTEVVALFDWPPVFADMQRWVADQKASGKALKLEWYAEVASARLTASPPPMYDYARMELTPYGERMTRPDKVPA